MFSSVRGVAFQLIITGVLLLWHRERGQRSATDATVAEGLALGLARRSRSSPAYRGRERPS